jgi:hypothetical protein
LNARPVVYADAMIVIEAVRTRCWNAITGQREIVTVTECAAELRRGDTSAPGYVRVGNGDIARLTVEMLPDRAVADFLLRYAAADGMDKGERDLLALVYDRDGDFQLCSCDKAAVRAAHVLGWLDRVVSLEVLAGSVGCRPSPALRSQFTESRMREWRASLIVGGIPI